MGAQYGSWTVLGAVALCAALGVVSGRKMAIPEKLTWCGGDTIMEASVEQHEGADGQHLFSGYVYTPVDVDEKFLLVLEMYLPMPDGGTEDKPTVLKLPDPCRTLKSSMPDMLDAIASMVNREAECPAPKGNYSFTDQTMKIPVDSMLLPLGDYKVHVESFLEDNKASCADMAFKLVNE
ncbi:uncharacterized protein LOC124547748 [Schistocerca americana]|uniref:uncharacterized protein LOC124547748 n=1 Tax=Schistocerca americana TaxID=7009 RepID=UPI001F4F19B1|nr:uncharacterized protein LOC124547748 [Schistocerca americana]